jgi:type III secretion protein R
LNAADGNVEGQPAIIVKMAALAILALLPFIIMLMTSFLKIVIVFSLLRNAIGVQQSPPNQALNGMALLMSIYVMFPTGVAMYDAAKTVVKNSPPQELFSSDSAFYVINVIDQAKDPLKDFLKRNTSTKTTRYFYQLAYRKFPENYRTQLTMDDFVILVPAYVTSQIKSAFEVGVLIYLPFFVIDLVTSNILLAMGMMMLSPLTIALPLKLLLIVMIDGWTLIVQGLVLSFR